jgi:uncharacterized protein YjiS (DUF1127 family)
MEMIMSTLFDTSVRQEGATLEAGGAVMAAIRGALAAYLAWRAQVIAVAQLKSMTDRELQDIGLTRAEIAFAVKGGRPRDRVHEMLF